MPIIYSNPELDGQISEIRKKIGLLMNGVTSDSMKSKGLVYKQNFGVAISHLRMLAAQYQPNSCLARRLWSLDIRETMIMATFLQPANEFTEDDAYRWLTRCTNSELMEQSCMNLYRNLQFAPHFCTKCVLSGNETQQIFGFMLARRIYGSFTPEQAELLISSGVEISRTADLQLCSQIGSCLAGLCRRNQATAEKIRDLLQEFQNDSQAGISLIHQAIRQELIFLGYISEDF
jgi:hypothetical protein